MYQQRWCSKVIAAFKPQRVSKLNLCSMDCLNESSKHRGLGLAVGQGLINREQVIEMTRRPALLHVWQIHTYMANVGDVLYSAVVTMNVTARGVMLRAYATWTSKHYNIHHVKKNKEYSCMKS